MAQSTTMGARSVLERRFRMALLQGRRARPRSFAECRNFARRCAVADLVFPVLAVKRADTGVKVERVGSQAVQLVDGARAEVDAGGRGASEVEFLRRDVGQRIEEDIDAAAAAVAQRGGLQNRQHEVVTFPGAVGPHGLDRTSTRLNSRHSYVSRMLSSARK